MALRAVAVKTKAVASVSSSNVTPMGWELIVIHNFCGADAPEPEDDCMGGASPSGGFTYAGAAAGLPYDGELPLYGASMEGGEGEAGIIYELKPRKEDVREKDKEEWRVKELYVFCAPDGSRGSRARPARDVTKKTGIAMTARCPAAIFW